jgi:hypothetical protein
VIVSEGWKSPGQFFQLAQPKPRGPVDATDALYERFGTSRGKSDSRLGGG